MKIMLASNIKNDDDYREVVKARMVFAVILLMAIFLLSYVIIFRILAARS